MGRVYCPRNSYPKPTSLSTLAAIVCMLRRVWGGFIALIEARSDRLSLQSLAASRRSLCCPSRSEVVTTVHILIPARYCTCGGMDRQRRGADGGIFRPYPYLVAPAKGRQGRIGHRAAHRPCAPSHSFNTTLAPTPPPLSLRKVSRRPQSSPNPGSDCARSDHSGERIWPTTVQWVIVG